MVYIGSLNLQWFILKAFKAAIIGVKKGLASKIILIICWRLFLEYLITVISTIRRAVKAIIRAQF